MSPWRITCVALDMGCGGAQRVMHTLTSTLADAGHNVTLALFDGGSADFFPIDPRVRRVPPLAPQPPRFHPLDALGRWRRFVAIRNLILGTAPDVVICFEDIPNVEVLLSLAGERIPVIACEHSDPRFHLIPVRWAMLRRLVYPWAAAVVVLNDEIARWCSGVKPAWKVVTIPNPVESPQPAAGATRPSYFGPRNVVAVGRLVPQKGFGSLIDAFAHNAHRRPEWHLTILGDGEERASLERQIREHGLGSRIHLVGAVEEPMRIIPHADLFVMSSRYEGFGMALVEAMAAGLPVISFACPSGPAAIIHDGIDGVLVPPGDIPALAEAIANLMDDADGRQRLGAAARHSARRYAPENIGLLWDDLLRRVTGTPRTPTDYGL